MPRVPPRACSKKRKLPRSPNRAPRGRAGRRSGRARAARARRRAARRRSSGSRATTASARSRAAARAFAIEIPPASSRGSSRTSTSSPKWWPISSASGRPAPLSAATMYIASWPVSELSAASRSASREVVDVDVAPEALARAAAERVAQPRPEAARVVALPLHPGRPDRDRAQVRARDRGVHQLLAEDAWPARRGPAGGSRAPRRSARTARGTRRSAKRHPGDGLAGDVDEPVDADADAGLDEVERRHQVVAEHLVRRVARRLGQRRAVDHDVLAAHDGERVARIGQVGLEVVRAGVAAFVHRRGEVAAGDAGGRLRSGRGSWPRRLSRGRR